jgi:hypothetical protein
MEDRGVDPAVGADPAVNPAAAAAAPATVADPVIVMVQGEVPLLATQVAFEDDWDKKIYYVNYNVYNNKTFKEWEEDK